MRLLAIDTATSATSVAIGDGDVLEVHAAASGRHTEVLAPTIVDLLARRGWSPQELDGVVVDVGPGLFTGLRVGIATAKGLAVATGVGLFAVTSTDVLAQAASEAGASGLVAAVVDARRGEVFWAAYVVGAGAFEQVGPVAVCPPGAVVASLDERGEPATLVGDGVAVHRDVLEGTRRVVLDDVRAPSAGAAIRLARGLLGRGAALLGHDAVHPWYLREADAVANFTVRGPGG